MKKSIFTLMMVLLATLAAQAATPINVAGKDISCDKNITLTASDVTDIKSGTVTYTYSTNTLTLTNVTITRTGGSNYAIHNRSNQGLIVKFVGTCNLTTEGRVIRDQSQGENQLVANSGATVNLKSTGNGAIYVKNFTTLWIKGPGTFNITGDKDGAIAGHRIWNASVSDLSSIDNIKFSNVTATVSGAQGALLGGDAYFYSGSNVTLKATNNSSYPVIREESNVYFKDNTAILAPWGVTSSNIDDVYNQDIYISDDYALLLNTTNFPDVNFLNAMLSLYPKGYLTTYDLNNLTSLNVASKGISNMTGIEKLTALKTLYCYNNSFSTLNLNSNTALTYLDCAPNTNLTSLSIGSCTNLETLICYQTGITSLALSNLSKLKTLKCYSTKLTSLSVNNKSQLTLVDCSYCTSMTYAGIYSNSALTSLDIRGCTALATLECFTNALTTLNVKDNTAMTYLSCPNNSNLTTITGLANCTALKTIYCYNTSISDLSAVNSFSNLEKLSCYNTKISSLTLTNKTKLTEAYCYNNPQLTTANIYSNSALTKLRVDNCPALTALNCYSNNLTTLNMTGCTALQTLYCYYNYNLASVTGLANCAALKIFHSQNCPMTDLSALNSLSNLEQVICPYNKITSLTLTNKSKLTTVNFHDCLSLTTATITGNSVLTSLDLRWCSNLRTATITGNSALKGLDIYSCPALTTLECYSNKLTSLNLSGNTALTTLECYSNNLSSLDVSALTNLTTLWCYNNQLTALNVNNNTKLHEIYCSSNKLTTLNVSGKTAMTQLMCGGNQLTSLNVQGCSSLAILHCNNNKLTSLYVQGCTSLWSIECQQNQITAAGMTTLVNSLPTRSSSNKGTLNVLYNTGEGNVFNASHLSAAKAKYWYPKKYNGSSWVDITFGTRGDVNGDGRVNIDDVTTLIDILLAGTTPPDGADCSQDGRVNIDDVTVLIDYLLSGSW